jgi:asparagine synthase (glutamine-hydrolysing)
MRVPVKHKLGNLEQMKRIDENEAKKFQKFYMDYDDGKNVLRKAMTDILPDRIIKRRKQGFSSPDESWYRGENADYVKKILLNRKSISLEFINQQYIEKKIDEHINKRVNHRLLIWSFLCFEWWCRLFINGEKIDQ